MSKSFFFSLQPGVAVTLTSVLLRILLKDILKKQLPTEPYKFTYILYIPYNC